jgi:putative lipoic acid-binding regulatory protein
MKNIPSVTALESAHQFPEWFTFKVFGPGDDDFADACEDIIRSEMNDDKGRYSVQVRESSKGNHVCVTVEGFFSDAHGVRDAYAAFLELDDLRMIL